MRTIHFTYAGDPNNEAVCSPYTITKNLYNFLSKKTKVIYHDWCKSGPIDIGADDIYIGHPNYDPMTVTQWVFNNAKCHAKFSIHPLHTKLANDNLPFDSIAQKADGIFSIAGNYWIDTIDSTPFASWKPKITRLDIPVDLNYWKHIKTKFNSIGSRQLLYVGSSIPNKNLTLMAAILKNIPNIRLNWYGGSSDHHLARLPNVYVEGWQEFSKAKIAEICSKCDFFLNTSNSDANCTTLTEFGLASGLIPICTEASGYWHDESFINIPDDCDKAVKIINSWINKPNDDLVAKSYYNRNVAETRFNWDVFCNKIWDVLIKYM